MRVNFAQALCLALIGGPALGGLVVTLAGAGAENWRQLFAEPGLAGSVGLTLSVGFAATAAALGLAMGLLSTLVAANAGTRRRDDALALAPLLASPHSTLAVGLAFLIAPSGWIARLLSPLFGWTAPPDVATVGDPHGLALTLGLVVKETPFLLAVALAALRQFPVQAQMQAARALGYSRAAAFALIVAPQLYARIRWPVYAVLAYSLSVVDMALVLAPSHPAPLSLIALRGLTAPDLDQLGLGQAAAGPAQGRAVRKAAGPLRWRAQAPPSSASPPGRRRETGSRDIAPPRRRSRLRRPRPEARRGSAA